jgi:UDP:flavonoid glycosyltransferase YjiC (YdhE family)
MRLTALTVGSRGDTKPYLALAGLQRAGHQVTLATHRPIEPDARRLGLGFAPTEGNPRQVLETEQGDAWLEAGRHPLRGTRRLLAVARPLAARPLADATAACQDAEAIIYARGGLAVMNGTAWLALAHR